jgi:hypothetical protein
VPKFSSVGEMLAVPGDEKITAVDCHQCLSGRTASDERVRVGDSTQVQTPDRALRVHRFVTHDIGLEYHSQFDSGLFF